ncbi:hypothetical protein ISN44_As08g002470 [Arabidopsis suecica]|uniref:Uncharacterized protein n=1 Tax=Arabidopsis suecica TaxID=45249 RepID=A0A8T2B5I0_ARASU|nr:hypothetical protein ISN44_As08g002470 [Arabidopsis suecica]
MGSRNFTSPPGISNESSIAAWLIIRGIAAAVGYVTGPYLSDHEISKFEKRQNEILMDYEKYFEMKEKFWSDMVDRQKNLMGRRKRQ